VRAHVVESVRRLAGTSYVLRLRGPFPAVRPGQFAMLRTARGWPVLLPRPFSYFDVEPGDGGFASFFAKAIGPGTSALRDVAPGDQVIVVGPLGQPFPDVAPGEREPVCVAGGVGLAPFLLWARARQARGQSVPVLYGGANASAIVAGEDFPPGAQTFHVATDDGSRGFKGTVLDLYRDLRARGALDGEAPVYCCGPERMMEAVARECAASGVRCLVSLETYMACGYGVCNGCSVRVQSGGRFAGKVYVKTCVAGPVFGAEELVW
jgi:dihydroorotate dehydrogenase electron transfer subunit